MNDSVTLPLRDIHTLPPPSFWPPASGWWILAIAGLVSIIILSRWLITRFYSWRRGHRALKNLQQLHNSFVQHHNTSQFAAQLSILLRRVALHRFPRDRVAGLSGNNWLLFLDQTGGAGQFTHGPGQILVVAPYAKHFKEIDVEGLLKATQLWIKQNA